MKFKKGFTLFQIMIVVAIAVGVFAMSAPYALNFYNNQIAEETRSNVMDALQRARHNAELQKNDSAFGVDFTTVANSYVIFQGVSYDDGIRSQDEVYLITDGVDLLSDFSEVVFSKLTGLPNATGTISLTSGSLTRNILLGDNGQVSIVEP